MTATVVGARLRARLAELEINQTAAAEMCGVSRSVFSYWVGKRGSLPALESVDAVAAFLAVSRDDVLAMYPAGYSVRASRLPDAAAEIAGLRDRVEELERAVEALTKRVEGRR